MLKYFALEWRDKLPQILLNSTLCHQTCFHCLKFIKMFQVFRLSSSMKIMVRKEAIYPPCVSHKNQSLIETKFIRTSIFLSVKTHLRLLLAKQNNIAT